MLIKQREYNKNNENTAAAAAATTTTTATDNNNTNKAVGFYGPIALPVPNAPSTECH